MVTELFPVGNAIFWMIMHQFTCLKWYLSGTKNILVK